MNIIKYEKKIYSQNGEDGIIDKIFSSINSGGKKFIEFGFGPGLECNTSNLFLNKGWSGLLIDGDNLKVVEGKRIFNESSFKKNNQIKIVNSLITRENVNNLFSENLDDLNIDFLSIDIDGNDFWIWESIEIRPKVVVIEYNAIFGKKSITIPYEPNFKRKKVYPYVFYFGASLTALEKLAKKKGYYLIGCESSGVNAFFVRDDIYIQDLPQVSAEEAWNPYIRKNKHNDLMFEGMDFISI